MADVIALGRLLNARESLLTTHPYFATAAHAITFWERPGLGTVGVDERWRLYYDPKALKRWNDAELMPVFYHELLHLIRDHAGRCKRERALPLPWNLAADCELNSDLARELTLPRDALMPAKFGWPDGLLAEEYYRRFPNKQAMIRGKRGICSGNCGAGAGGTPDGSDEENAEAEGDGLSGVAKRLVERVLGKRGSRPRPGPSDGEGPAGLNGDEADGARDATAQAIGDAAGRGTVPGHHQRWAERHFGLPPINWRWLLAKAVRRGTQQEIAGAMDYSRSRPARRQAGLQATGIVFSALRAREPTVAVVVDTSSSMNQPALNAALHQVATLVRTMGCPFWVIICDAAVHSVQLVRRAGGISLCGGGGTDMRVGIARALELRPAPSVVLVLTDGETPWPQERPARTSVICGLIGEESDHAKQYWPRPPWMKTVRVPVEEEAEIEAA